MLARSHDWPPATGIDVLPWGEETSPPRTADRVLSLSVSQHPLPQPSTSSPINSPQLFQVSTGGVGLLIGGAALFSIFVAIFEWWQRRQIKMAIPDGEFAVTVELSGAAAARTKDFLQAEIQATIYVSIPDELRETASLYLVRNDEVIGESIAEAVDKRAEDAIRRVASRNRFKDLREERDRFAQEVTSHLEERLRKVGLKLDDVALADIGGSDIYGGEFAIDLVAVGEQAVRTKDYLQADIEATVYVYIDPEDEESIEKARSFLARGGAISESTITTAVRPRAIAAMRQVASQKELLQVHDRRQEFIQEIEFILRPKLEAVGLTLQAIAIADIAESDFYDSNDFFDCLGINARARTIHSAQKIKRQIELESQASREQQELLSQIRSLEHSNELEKAQIKYQLEIETFRAQQERDLSEQITTVEKAQIDRELILDQYRRARLAESNKEAEFVEIETAIALIDAELKRLAKEAEKTRAEEEVVTERELAKAERQEQYTKLIARAAEDEAERITTLARAESIRLKAEAEGQNTFTSSSRIAQLINILTPQILEHLPEIAKAMAPQPGVLDNAHIYNLGGERGGVDTSLLSTSGFFLLEAIASGKIGELLSQLVQGLQTDAGNGNGRVRGSFDLDTALSHQETNRSEIEETYSLESSNAVDEDAEAIEMEEIHSLEVGAVVEEGEAIGTESNSSSRPVEDEEESSGKPPSHWGFSRGRL